MLTQVRLLDVNPQTATVEWTDSAGNGLRGYIPTHELGQRKDDRAWVDAEILNAALPYGRAWELLPLGNVGAARVAQALHRRGLWTEVDLLTRVNEVKAALMDAYSSDLQILLTAAKHRDAR